MCTSCAQRKARIAGFKVKGSDKYMAMGLAVGGAVAAQVINAKLLSKIEVIAANPLVGGVAMAALGVATAEFGKSKETDALGLGMLVAGGSKIVENFAPAIFAVSGIPGYPSTLDFISAPYLPDYGTGAQPTL